MDENLYSPPTALLDPPPAPPREDQLASAGQRFLNLLLDRLGAILVGVVAMFPVGMLDPEAIDRVNEYALGVGITFLYYFGFEAAFGITLAKLITGTRVVSDRGGPPTAAQILVRTLVRLIPLEPFSFLGSPLCIGWHDSWSHTRVIRARR